MGKTGGDKEDIKISQLQSWRVVDQFKGVKERTKVGIKEQKRVLIL